MIFPALEVELSIKNILFATDFSDVSESAQEYALALCRHYGSKLITSCVQSPVPFQMVPPESSVFVSDRLEQLRVKQMQSWGARLDQAGISHKESIPVGDIADCLS